MAHTTNDAVLVETFGTEDTNQIVKQAVLVVLGVMALWGCAKIQVPMWPVPITMGTFGVLTIGAAYGPRLGLMTILAYMALGATGLDVFAGSSAEKHGIAYMMSGTGGYLVGYVLAVAIMGFAARRGWDRSVLLMAAAMLAANVAIYVPGIAWLGQLHGWDKPLLEWGLYKFILGDAIKLGLAALLVPTIWSWVGDARR